MYLERKPGNAWACRRDDHNNEDSNGLRARQLLVVQRCKKQQQGSGVLTVHINSISDGGKQYC